LQDSLRHKTESFIQHSENLEHRGESRSAIQSFIVPGNIAVREAASRIQQKGFDVRPIVSPTVPQGKERLRICIHTFNTNEEITGLAHALNTIGTRITLLQRSAPIREKRWSPLFCARR